MVARNYLYRGNKIPPFRYTYRTACTTFFNLRKLFTAFTSSCDIIKQLVSFTAINSTKQESVREWVREWQAQPMIGLGSDKNSHICEHWIVLHLACESRLGRWLVIWLRGLLYVPIQDYTFNCNRPWLLSKMIKIYFLEILWLCCLWCGSWPPLTSSSLLFDLKNVWRL